ncbi:protein YIF1B [Toxorhynchites rutilus septentrionalis]|uniref:protein YIF1B n=1 Tax=Toxorhynchites rutilus septentrionalis TaxID=329112 RepID=UPI0024795675|nr:protein YIF1B [Toxorhynchites rutilus septentrionalis]
MNFNANNARQTTGGGLKKPKRVSDVSVMGSPASSQFSSYEQHPAQIINPVGYPATNPGQYVPTNTYHQGYENYGNYANVPQQQHSLPSMTPEHINPVQQQTPSASVGPSFPGQFTVFQQPIVQDMAMQYGQKLADQGKELVHTHIERYIPVTKLKYYFAVDNKYVINKLRLIFFPFTQNDWSLKYDQDNPVQPRYDINAPDLYIPSMAYITYVVLAGMVLGLQNRFSPEQLGIQASSALAYSIFELIIYALILYIANIPTTLKALDLLALSGYKYASIVSILLTSIFLKKPGYYIAWLYASAALVFFLLRTLKAKVLSEPIQTKDPPTYDPYLQQQQQFEHTVGRKRKLYFLFLVTGLQPVLAFWLSMHLIPNNAAVVPIASTT